MGRHDLAVELISRAIALAPNTPAFHSNLGEAYRKLGQIEKAITTGTGLVAYDLQAPAKNLYPVNAPLIRSLPRTGGVGTATNWKAITGLQGSGFDATGWVPEGQRASPAFWVSGRMRRRAFFKSWS